MNNAESKRSKNSTLSLLQFPKPHVAPEIKCQSSLFSMSEVINGFQSFENDSKKIFFLNKTVL